MDVSYTYRQTDCQQHCHFNGDEEFSVFLLHLDDKEWNAWFENPFCFYDRDGDGVTEDVIRITGNNEKINDLRWSFDANNNATLDAPYNYDVSLSAHAREGLTFDEREGKRLILQGIPTKPILKYDALRAYLRPIVWKDMMLTWDENDNNVENQVGKETFERWEGVIAAGNEHFAQLGGPNCGIFNKRYELVQNPRKPIHSYYSPADQRLHLDDADTAWVLVDYDLDGKADMRYDLIDSDHDGAIDTWKIDLDGDGKTDDTWTSKAPVRPVAWEWARVHEVIAPVLEKVPGQLIALNQALAQAIKKLDPHTPEDAVARLIRSGFKSKTIIPLYAEKFRSSKESQRYYHDLLKDRLIGQLKTRYQQDRFWSAFNALRGKGDIDGMRGLIRREFGLARPVRD